MHHDIQTLIEGYRAPGAAGVLLTDGVAVMRYVGDGAVWGRVQKVLMNESGVGVRDAPTVEDIHQHFAQKNTYEDKEYVKCLTGALWKCIQKNVYEDGGVTYPLGYLYESPNMQVYTYRENSEEYAIPPHKDFKASVEVVAIMLVSGPSLFCVWKESGGQVEVEATVGDVILLRGYGYRGMTTRPLHAVMKIPEGEHRVTLGFRMIGEDVGAVTRMNEKLNKNTL